MPNDEYLQALLKSQDLTPMEENALRNLRAAIEGQLGVLSGHPRFYYGGSYGKKTIIRQHYDLDLVAYWPSDCTYTLKGIYGAVGDVIKKHWPEVKPKTVSWEIQFQGGFHIDIVPGRAIDSYYKNANLYRRDKDSTLKTSIKMHIDRVRDSGKRDVIRLMKLWKVRKNIPLKTFILEIMVVDGARGISLESNLISAFRHIRDSIVAARVVDPANSNNILSDEIQPRDKVITMAAAQATLDAKYWSEVFGS